jgi:hypothetical protein
MAIRIMLKWKYLTMEDRVSIMASIRKADRILEKDNLKKEGV